MENQEYVDTLETYIDGKPVKFVRTEKISELEAEIADLKEAQAIKCLGCAKDGDTVKAQYQSQIEGVFKELDRFDTFSNHATVININSNIEKHISEKCPKCKYEAFKQKTLEEMNK